MLSLHHSHIMASDIDATIRFWTELFDAIVVHDVVFAGSRNVFLRIGTGRLHLYDQPPKRAGAATVHHLGIETDALQVQVDRLRQNGVSVSSIKTFSDASYAMCEAPDALLLELFEVNPEGVSKEVSGFFDSLSPSKRATAVGRIG